MIFKFNLNKFKTAKVLKNKVKEDKLRLFFSNELFK